ncbi:MAG: hypothetical protein ACLTE2_05280 [Eubacteriales bacterium]
MERLMTRIVYGSANGRELRSLLAAIERLPALQHLLEGVHCDLLQDTEQQIDLLEDVAKLIFPAIVEDPPFSIREGGIIKQGYHAELDQLKSDMTNGKELIAQIEAKEKELIYQKLKIGYNRVFGYYIEISNSYKSQAPAEYIRKQTLSNCERYITQELKDLEARILGAHDVNPFSWKVCCLKKSANKWRTTNCTVPQVHWHMDTKLFIAYFPSTKLCLSRSGFGRKDCAERKPPPCCGSVIGRRSVCSKRCTVR